MAVIYVKTKAGRRLFHEGKPIPLDSFVPVSESPYINRLIHHWGDLEVQGDSGKKAPAKAPIPKAPAPAN